MCPFIVHSAVLSAFAGCSALPINLLKLIIVPPIMKFTNQSRSCHPERSEGSLCPSSQTLRFAQGDTGWQLMHIDEILRPHRRCRFIAHTADLSAFSVDVMVSARKRQSA